MTSRIDVPSLCDALEAERKARGLSWRKVALEAKVSPSLLSRMTKEKKHRPDLESFASLVLWLGAPAETFMRDDRADRNADPSFESKLMPLLRAERDLDEQDRKYLLDLVTATMKYLRANRQDT